MSVERMLVQMGDHEADPLLSSSNCKQVPDHKEGLSRTHVPFGGVVRDIKQRAQFFVSDYSDGICWKTLSASLYMFFATFASTVALGELARRQTDNHIGVTEYLLLQGGCGLIHALLAGQPLLILRPTGPITVFITELYTLSHRFKFDYFEWLAWVGLWVGIYMTIISAFDGSHYIKLFTRFLHDLYAAFVCTIYAYDGIHSVVQRFTHPNEDLPHLDNYARALFAMILALLVIGVALYFHMADSRTLFPRQARKLIADYALTIAVFVAIGVSYSTQSVVIDRIELPSSFSPTYHHNTTDYGESRARDWLVDLHPKPDWMVGAAAVAAIPIVALFYIDQSISALLTQVPSVRLAKGAYFHFSFFITGLFNAAFPLFGLPFVTASLPHSPQFARALSDTTRNGQVLKVRENRLAPLIVYGLCLVAIWARPVLTAIPEGVVDGILTFVGVSGLLAKNQFIERVWLLLTPASDHPENEVYTAVPAHRMHLYTLVQLVCLACCWIIKQTPAGLAFPLFIVLLVPFRNMVMPKLFTVEELEALDSEDIDQTDDDDDVAYQRLI
eukprot:TRINITY_DN10511_c0_g2_i1.p1 TRINITY_DN10511_c0_g2~~TRINITY_DN10511_c0_g2_i1.p1  ORF type:complete len:558 (+),score=118.55 TRINITY_DN10511_c0_g2_i1:61-1734(+)